MSIKELTDKLSHTEKARNDAVTEMNHERRVRLAAEASEKETRQQFTDLKKRLHDAETEVARLNGYIARVREDDTVREDLVTVGDPAGEQRMVPKRKHEYLGGREPNLTSFEEAGTYGYRDRPKPKHWIEY